MKRSLKGKLIVPALALGMAVSIPAFAQTSSNWTPEASQTTSTPSASQDFRQAGSDVTAAGESAGQSAKYGYEGTKRAVEDTATTARVKSSFHHNKDLQGSDISVHTKAGIVTLSGTVASKSQASRAEQIAMQTKGVQKVVSALHVGPQQ